MKFDILNPKTYDKIFNTDFIEIPTSLTEEQPTNVFKDLIRFLISKLENSNFDPEFNENSLSELMVSKNFSKDWDESWYGYLVRPLLDMSTDLLTERFGEQAEHSEFIVLDDFYDEDDYYDRLEDGEHYDVKKIDFSLTLTLKSDLLNILPRYLEGGVYYINHIFEMIMCLKHLDFDQQFFITHSDLCFNNGYNKEPRACYPVNLDSYLKDITSFYSFVKPVIGEVKGLVKSG